MAAPQLTVGRYNPAGYVPGGASPAVAKAIVKKATIPSPQIGGGVQIGGPGSVVSDPRGYYDPSRGVYVPTPYTAPNVNPVVAPVVGGGATYQTDAQNRGNQGNQYTNPMGSTRPDINALIAGDYEVQQAQTDAATRMAQLRDSFTANVRRALIDLGVSDTSQLGKFGSYIDPATIQQAIGNKYSANAQIAQNQQKSMDQTASALAARGALNSGWYTNEAGNINADAEKSRYDALQSFLNSGETGLSDIANQQYGADQAIATARANAANRASQYDLAWLNYQDELDRSQGGGGSVPAATPPPPNSTPNVVTGNPPALPGNAFQQMTPTGYYDLIRHMWVNQ